MMSTLAHRLPVRFRCHILATVTTLLICTGVAFGQVPGEVTGVTWCSGPKTCLQWSPVGSATEYRVSRGGAGGFSSLSDASVDSCQTGAYFLPTTGSSLADTPTLGTDYWYLVVAANVCGQGPAGNMTAGPRFLNSSGPCNPQCTDGVIDGAETALDCGGPDCPACAAGQGCVGNADCASHVCSAGTCQTPTCADVRQNGSETGVDCGGACLPCPNGTSCCSGSDCQSDFCSGGSCMTFFCANGVQDGNETGVDCGGGTCPACGTGQGCAIDADCQSHICNAATHTCRAPACNDGVRNGTETDVDCGGGACLRCSNGRHCLINGDCANAYCDLTTNTCQTPTCSDGIKNGFETDVDCGGSCPNDCANGQGCTGNGDCQSGNCVAHVCQPMSPDGSACSVGTNCQSGNCVDGVCCHTSCSGTCVACNLAGSVGTCSNVPAGTDPADECSGAVTCNGNGGCGAPNGTPCTGSALCGSANCVDGVCCNTSCNGICKECDLPGSVGTCSNVPAGTDPGNDCSGPAVCNGAGACSAGACGNGVEDGNETDIDCGGGTCLPCGTGLGCSIDSDCQSHICSVATHTCQAPACNDGVRNGSETDVDCGGSCAQCANGQHCLTTSDCASSNCDPVTGTCQVSTCTNGVRDGFETDVDCGGPCPNDCAIGQGCAGNADCQSGNCVAQVCQPRTPDGSACSVGTNCLSGNCVDGVCCGTSCSGSCMACNLAGSVGTCTNIPAGTDPANECSGAVTCNGNGGCGAPNGTACTGSVQCGSANCVDGVCCNTSCNGTCKECDLPGSVGTCSNIPAGTDPGNECSGPAVCNGAGACSAGACGNGVEDGNETDIDCGGGTCLPCGTGLGCSIDSDCQSHICSVATHTCQAPACNDGVRNGSETDVDCGGSCAQCANGQHCLTTSDCASSNCDPVTGTCQVSTCTNGVRDGFETDVDCGGPCPNDCANGLGCAGNGDCQSGNCVAQVCQPRTPDGSACSVGTNCLSGNCVDGVCCSTSCSGACMACNLAGSLGTCTNIPAGTDPANECSGAVTCNGNGGCGAPNGTACSGSAQCGSANCVDGVCCNTSCSGSCKACDLPGSVGTCSNIPAGTDPGNECPGARVCNGAGACTP